MLNPEQSWATQRRTTTLSGRLGRARALYLLSGHWALQLLYLFII